MDPINKLAPRSRARKVRNDGSSSTMSATPGRLSIVVSEKFFPRTQANRAASGLSVGRRVIEDRRRY